MELVGLTSYAVFNICIAVLMEPAFPLFISINANPTSASTFLSSYITNVQLYSFHSFCLSFLLFSFFLSCPLSTYQLNNSFKSLLCKVHPIEFIITISKTKPHCRWTMRIVVQHLGVCAECWFILSFVELDTSL
jgi:hypothetical protein